MNPNRKTLREIFAKTCQEFLEVVKIKNELDEVMEKIHRKKIEKINKDVSHIMRTAWKKVEGKMIGSGKSTQKRKLRAKVLH